TYQAWNGIDAATMKTNRRFNSAGAIYNEDWSEVIGFYDNETDNYQQHHNHLIWDQKYGGNWNSNTTLFYTRGKGYYENYKQGAALAEYKIESDLEYSDLVRQKWLDNHFYGLNFNLENQHLGKFKFFTGFSASQFKNNHYGTVTWVKDFENQHTDIEFYRNKSEKNDVSVYAKALLSLNKFELFGDLQYRFVQYKGIPVAGGDNEFEDFFPFEGNFNFLNPKVGLNFYANSQNVLYFYYGLAHREPHRGDYLENSDLPRPEKLHDFELGYKKSGRLNLNINGFFMYYIDQLVATGELNDVGEYKRTNSGKSYRTGIELGANYDIIPQKLNIFGNLTYSLNQNLDYSEISYDADWNEILVEYGDTDISFSPNWIGAFGIQYKPVKSLVLNVQNKYVGEQFLTNTELSDGKLDAYFLTDLIINYAPNWFNWKNLEFSLLINNVFDVEYESNGFYYEGPFYYPQAGINILGGFKIRL
ncbi:MAG TPA: TonB-dependent receptor, partial [Moheibacter sp.]|nr:TonB-dependent receptor [Moheibacter sp.]